MLAYVNGIEAKTRSHVSGIEAKIRPHTHPYSSNAGGSKLAPNATYWFVSRV